MRVELPLVALRCTPHAVLLADSEGRLRVCSRAAAALLRVDPGRAEGRTCWTVARFHTLEDEPFCSPDCPIQRDARRGETDALYRVIVRVPTEPPLRIEVLTLLTPTRAGDRQGALHILLPAATPPVVAKGVGCSAEIESLPRPRLDLLSPREFETLRLMALGLDTAGIAARLRISRLTVRSHIQKILTKLRVHRRVEAVLVFLGRTSQYDSIPD